MSIHTGIRSREGNAIVGLIGVAYIVAALAVLVTHVAQTMQARTFLETFIDAVLTAAVVLGGWFVTESIHALLKR